MIRVLAGGLALGLGLASTVAQSNAAGARSLPMQFHWWQEGPATACGSQCRTWVSAVGNITSETPRDFAAFARAHDLRGATLMLNSAGGSVHGAMALGRQVRGLDMTTTVGRTIALPGQSGDRERRARLSPRADCESMCAFVLLAGTTRVVPLGARVLVHQIWLGDRRDDAAAAVYSAEDLVLVQRDIGRLAQYTVEMGGSIDLFELSLRIPPWEPMRALSREELRRMRVESGPDKTIPPRAPVAAAVSSQAAIGGPHRGPEAGARGWVVAKGSGLPVLRRSHPLTVEGVEIGTFDLTVACGETPDSFEVAYRERRLATNSMMAPLKTVTLALNGRSESLHVTSSERMPGSSKFVSHARGSVPASFIRPFSETSRRAMVVRTVTTGDARTAIRVGNSGLAEGFERMSKSCSGRSLHAAHAPDVTGGIR